MTTYRRYVILNEVKIYVFFIISSHSIILTQISP